MEMYGRKGYMELKSALTGKLMYANVNGVIAMYQDEIYGYDASKGETNTDYHPVKALVLVYSGDYKVFVHPDDEQGVMDAIHDYNSRWDKWF